jgi:hypothetical protein
MPVYLRIAIVMVIVAMGGVIVFAGVGVLGRVVGGVASSLQDTFAKVTTSPSPSPVEAVAPNAPALTVPQESYTNQKTVDLTGTVPGAFIGQPGVTVRIYRSLPDQAPTQIDEVPVGETAGFIASGVELANGRNDFTATLSSPGGESDPSKAVTYVLDKTKPKITISKPSKDTVVNGKSVTIVGKTQPRSDLVATNEANHASITGTADDAGSFKLVLAIANGPNGIKISATDPANNQASVVISVNRGKGALNAEITASRYQFIRRQLPDNVVLTATVTDPDGHPLDGATVTFSLTMRGVAPITRTVTTDGEGKAKWSVTIPKGAGIGRGVAAILVQTKGLGQTSAQTFLNVYK